MEKESGREEKTRYTENQDKLNDSQIEHGKIQKSFVQ